LCKTSEFTSSGYAELEVMFEYQEDLAEIIRIYIERKIFENLLPSHPDCNYVINSIDRVEVTHDGIKMIGRTYRWPVKQQ
jgi:hypothetical protein